MADMGMYQSWATPKRLVFFFGVPVCINPHKNVPSNNDTPIWLYEWGGRSHSSARIAEAVAVAEEERGVVRDAESPYEWHRPEKRNGESPKTRHLVSTITGLGREALDLGNPQRQTYVVQLFKP